MKTTSLISQKNWMNLFFVTVFAVGPLVIEFPAFADKCSDATKGIENKCQAEGNKAKAIYVNSPQQSGMALTAGQQKLTADQTAAAHEAAASACLKFSDDCNNACDKQKDPNGFNKCKQAVVVAANKLYADGTSFKLDGSDWALIATLAGTAGVGALALSHMGGSSSQQQPQPSPSSTPSTSQALQPNCSLNCQYADSYKYADCNTFLTQACANYGIQTSTTTTTTTPVTGTIISSGGMSAQPDCASFNARYCSQTQAAATSGQCNLANTNPQQIAQLNMAGSGEGYSTTYCQNWIASTWCSADSSRSVCPSCRQLQTNLSSTCQTSSDPASCLANQTTSTTTDSTVCAGDPLSQPGGSLAGVGTTSGSTPITSLPDSTFVTPGPTASTSTSTSTTSSLPTADTSAAVSSQVKTQSSSAGTREVAGGGTLPSDTYSGGSSGGVSTGYQTSSVNSDMIAAGGVIVARGGSATPSRGPASDVQGQTGPSLFSTGSQAISKWCHAKVQNCP